MLAKGRLLGIQFDELFTDDLYLQLGRQGIETAERMKEIFRELDYKFYLESSHQSAVSAFRGRRGGGAAKEGEFQLLGEAGCKPYGGTVCHQLGHYRGNAGEAA